MRGEPVSREERKPFTQTTNRCRWPQRAAEAPKSPFDRMWPQGRSEPDPLARVNTANPTDTWHPSVTTYGHDPRIRLHSRFSWRRLAIAGITERSVTALGHCHMHAGLLESSHFAGVGVPISDHLIDI